MEKITISKFVDLDGQEYEQVMIDRGNGEFSSMPKAVYDELKANEAKIK